MSSLETEILRSLQKQNANLSAALIRMARAHDHPAVTKAVADYEDALAAHKRVEEQALRGAASEKALEVSYRQVERSQQALGAAMEISQEARLAQVEADAAAFDARMADMDARLAKLRGD